MPDTTNTETKETTTVTETLPVTTPAAVAYQILSAEVVGGKLMVLVKTPSGQLYKGIVTNWLEVTTVEIKT